MGTGAVAGDVWAGPAAGGCGACAKAPPTHAASRTTARETATPGKTLERKILISLAPNCRTDQECPWIELFCIRNEPCPKANCRSPHRREPLRAGPARTWHRRSCHCRYWY